ncbi:GAF domain-containing protein [Acuticoccus yangtzensis]|uniref:GAF domain-containing protein n=1 Tax=Acuticoccus yangtzensis TaxID=1443441 RepID=UPI0009499533|nr:GAF domain-containing protein [Acuticoccus yangtzensis]
MDLAVTNQKAGNAAGKRAFVRAFEVWVPSHDKTELVLAAGSYGELTEFESVAKETTFKFDEGLPGKAWARRTPIILKDLQGSYFLRGPAAARAGLTCGVALPILQGNELKGVIVFFCGDDRQHVGAIETWRSEGRSPEMGLFEGYYGTAEVFEWTARRIHFVKGSGLPGLVWAKGLPQVFTHLTGPRFLRWEKAAEVGITRGVGIPVRIDEEGAWVMAFLSALDTPIASRVEVWSPNADGVLGFTAGYCESIADLHVMLGSITVRRGEGTIGIVFATGVPAINNDVGREDTIVDDLAKVAGMSSIVAFPVYRGADLACVIAWYL